MSEPSHESWRTRSGRLRFHHEQLVQSLAELCYASNVRKTLADAFRRAKYDGFEDEEIHAMVLSLARGELPHHEAILAVLQELTPDEIAIDAHAPELNIGQDVRVILSFRNQTAREGSIIDRVWHHKDRRWNYYMEENGKRLSKRYFAEDLLSLGFDEADSWLSVTFVPGFSPLKRVCTVEITDSGRLTQSFFEGRAFRAEDLISSHSCALDETGMELIRGALAAIDFPRLAARLLGARDASQLSIVVFEQGRVVAAICGNILGGHRGDHGFRGSFEPARKFWKLLLDLLPEKLR